MRSWVWPDGGVRTVWASHTFVEQRAWHEGLLLEARPAGEPATVALTLPHPGPLATP